jgi:inhibitor of KinA
VTGPTVTPGVVPFGDQALLAVLGETVDESVNARVHALAAAVRAERGASGIPWGEPVPGYASLLVPYDVRRLTLVDAQRRLDRLVEEALRADTPLDVADLPVATIPVRYGGEDGPDLAEVARRTGLSESQVVELHVSVAYRVFLLGFVPGFAYLGTLPEELALPRRDTPRLRVPAGSVAIAERQTAVYPTATPGGWHLIGRTDVRMWDAAAESPSLLRPGQRVRFVPMVA